MNERFFLRAHGENRTWATAILLGNRPSFKLGFLFPKIWLEAEILQNDLDVFGNKVIAVQPILDNVTKTGKFVEEISIVTICDY